ncbi:flagellar assembly protein FliW [Egibacter rhizosphaerae]|uniref:flagellar assembly protein FliW n=1 Tax=Egibacter rhizosphaerae TaxID=1670831 RepID=UPI0013F1574B|nr:flagellar assembly protein FliW [Egibacter rhizosphaerae]
MTVATDPDTTELHLDEGLLGFRDARRFRLVDLDRAGTFQVLESLDREDLSIVVCAPWVFFPEYVADIGEDEERWLELSDPSEAVLLTPVVIDTDQKSFHLNLLGPIVFNARTRRGKQVVLAESGHPARATVSLDRALDDVEGSS